MAKESPAPAAQTEKKSLSKAELVRLADPAGQAALVDASLGLAAAAGDGTVETQISRLGDRRMQAAQRQALAAQIGRMQGNQHLQRVMFGLQRQPEEEEIPVPSHDTGNPVVQRGVLDEAASALLGQVMGRANSEQGQVQSEAGSRASEVDSDAASRGGELQSESASQASQAEMEALAQGTGLDADAGARGEQAQSQAGEAKAELRGSYTELNAQAASGTAEAESQAGEKIGELDGQTGVFEAQLRAGQEEMEAQATPQVSALEEFARSVYSSSQERARTLLAEGDDSSEGIDRAQAAIEAGWGEVLDRVMQAEAILTAAWERLSQRANELWEAVTRRAEELARWLEERVQVIWERIQGQWARLASLASGALERLRSTAAALWNGLRERATQLLNNLRTRVSGMVEGLRSRAAAALETLRSRGSSLVSALRQRAVGAVNAVLGLASSLLGPVIPQVRQVIDRLRQAVNSGVDFLVSKAADAARRLFNAGSAVVDRLASLGTGAVQRLAAAGEAAWNRLRSLAERAVSIASAAWDSLRSSWEGLAARAQSLFQRARQGFDTVRRTLRERVFQPIWDGVTRWWQNFKEGTVGGLGKILRGWRRLRAWGASARARMDRADDAEQDAIEAETQERANAPFESVFYKAQAGYSPGSNDPRAVRKQLGAGRPLDDRVRGPMEAAFGESLAGVRVHTDPRAARLAGRMNARAFAVGRQVAFGPGEYQPGTPVGDALIAHELSHVLQQRNAAAVPAQKGFDTDSALEMDADRSAIGAVAALWTGEKDGLKRIPAEAMPRLRSSLRLSSCRRKACPPGTAPATVSFGTINAPNTPSGINRIPPRKVIAVPVTVAGWDKCMGPIVISVENAGGVSGTVTLNGGKKVEVESNGVTEIKVEGTNQTVVPSGSGITLVAKQDGKVKLADSNGFWVAAYPSGASFAPAGAVEGEPFEGVLAWGGRYKLGLSSDSGDSKDLFDTRVSENINVGRATGLFSGMKVTQSTFIVSDKPQVDTHAIVGGSGTGLKASIDADPSAIGEQIQFLRFSDDRTGIVMDRKAGPIVPNSGFKITLTVSKTPAGEYAVIVKKEGFANASSAGTVDGSGEQKARVV